MCWMDHNGCGPRCAMGLVPGASRYPADSKSFGHKATTLAVRSFGDWFDAQFDAQATVDAIWGREEPPDNQGDL